MPQPVVGSGSDSTLYAAVAAVAAVILLFLLLTCAFCAMRCLYPVFEAALRSARPPDPHWAARPTPPYADDLAARVSDLERMLNKQQTEPSPVNRFGARRQT